VTLPDPNRGLTTSEEAERLNAIEDDRFL